MKRLLGLVGALALVTADVSAADLPNQIAWTAYDVGSSGYGQAIAIGAALKNKKGITLRVLPGKNDVSRLVPLREGKVDFSAFGIGGFHAMEGTQVFGMRDWGPQPIRLLAMSKSDACNTILLADDKGMRTFHDLKGKRLPLVRGAPALNEIVYAFLRFADLTWDDVEVVEFGGNAASLDGIVEGQVDGAAAVTTSGFATKIAASPRGLYHAPVPHDDEEGWARLRAIGPWFLKATCREGAGIIKPYEGANYPYPILIAYPEKDEEMVYQMTSVLFELFPEYRDAAPGASGWALERQALDWVMSFHPGAIRYYREQGMWTEEHQAMQDDRLAREKVLLDAWEAYRASPEDQFEKGWMKARAEALSDAGLEPIWTEW